MDHVATVTVRDLRYRFPEIETLLQEGKEVRITKRKRLIAKLVPVVPEPAHRRPDFLARLKKIYGEKRLEPTGADLISRDRDRG
jgi:antitoxin (DNA-binding transcriptional repressor) of toxin-antitoxin stability system